jgi:hypothetical protein
MKMKDFILENGEKVALTDKKIACILADIDRRVEKGRYRIVYDSVKDAERTTVLLPVKQRISNR